MWSMEDEMKLGATWWMDEWMSRHWTVYKAGSHCKFEECVHELEQEH